MRVNKIKGYDYKVPSQTIVKALSQYGDIMTKLVENIFKDNKDLDGTNAMGIYLVKIKLRKPIPQVLPLEGKRVKVYYHSIRKLCANCFGRHPRKDFKMKRFSGWIMSNGSS